VVTIWFPGKLRATANSLCIAGSSVGAILAPPLVAWLALTFNWQVVFFVGGTVGLIIALLWWLVYRDPPGRIAQEALASAGPATGSFKWSELWRTRSLYGIILIRFISDPVWYFCLFWLPGYLQEESGLSLAQIGMFGWIPFLAADIGAIGTSAWSDRLVRKGKQPFTARKIMLITTAVFAPLCMLTPYLPDAFSTILIFSIVAVVCLSWLFTIPVVGSEVFPVKNVASVMGISGGFGALGAILFNYFVGQVMGTIGANKIFLVMGFLHLIAAAILLTMVRPEKPKALPVQQKKILISV
jgi:ACS family hexuronate transporter-like MFS transporter